MTDFISANQLKKIYSVYGHFYAIRFPEEPIPCRSVLEIISNKSCPTNFSDLSNSKPDAVFIMMNPGSSSPLISDGTKQYVHYSEIGRLKISLVKAKPDTTQYQVMRIMNKKKWAHTRIINLSDIRNPKSDHFISTVNKVEIYEGGESHSIFSSSRKDELFNKLKRKRNAPVVCAWGVSNDLDPLICRCLNNIGNNNVGILKEGTSDKYYHPLPSLQRFKEQWILNMLKQLETY